MSFKFKALCIYALLLLSLETVRAEENSNSEVQNSFIATETSVLNKDAYDKETISENQEIIEETATETTNIEPPEPALYTEPFTETDLSFLEVNFDGLNKNYTYNYHTSQLKLAFLTLNKKLDKTHKKYEYKKVIGPIVAPYKITACTGIFPEFAKIAEKIRLQIIKKAEERIVKGDIENTLNQIQKDFKLIDDMQEHIHQTVLDNLKCIEDIEKNYLNYNNWIKTRKADTLLDYLHTQCKDLTDVYEAYKNHSEFCDIYLKYAINEPSNIKQAIGFSAIMKHTEDFISYYEYYRNQFIELTDTSRFMQPTLYIERDRFIKAATKSINKTKEVKNALNKFPNFLKSPAPNLTGLSGKETLKFVFSTLNKLCDSPILKDELAMEDTIKQQKEKRQERSNKLLEALLPYLDPEYTELTPNYGLLFETDKINKQEEEDEKEESEN